MERVWYIQTDEHVCIKGVLKVSVIGQTMKKSSDNKNQKKKIRLVYIYESKPRGTVNEIRKLPG